MHARNRASRLMVGFLICGLCLIGSRGQTTTDLRQSDSCSCNSGCEADVGCKSALQQMQQQVAQLAAQIELLTNLTTLRLKPTAKVCPPNFTFLPAVNGCYKVQQVNLVWSNAAARCKQYNEDAHLVIINDDQEQNAVASMLKGAFISSGCVVLGQGNRFYTAGQRLNPEIFNSSFVNRVLSADGLSTAPGGLSEMTYSHFSPGEPNNFGNSIEACVVMTETVNYSWFDVSCLNLVSCSLCEIDLKKDNDVT